MKLQSTLEKLAKDGKMVISGKQGENILNFYTDTIKEITE